jgi:adenine phosphoribosyltransferase
MQTARMTNITLDQVRNAIRDVPDFPKPGILFKDITPVLADGALFSFVIGALADACRDLKPAKVVGIDARGFIFGAAAAARLGVGFVPVRKRGKLPYQTHSVAYSLEYGEAVVEMHTDAIQPGERVVLVDDLLATGGTSGAAVELIRRAGGDPVAALFFVELAFLKGRERLPSVPTQSLVVF